MKIRDNQSGFTLMELIIYIAIFSTMIGAVVGMALATTAERANAQIVSDINYQGEAAIALISQTTRQASTITSPATGVSSNSLSLTMANNAVNPTAFSSFNDGTTNRLQISEGSPATLNSLTNGRVSLSNLTFTNMGLPGSHGSILIKFTLSYRTTSVRHELNYSRTFYGAATLP